MFFVANTIIDLDGGYTDDEVFAYAHNIERRIFDHELRLEGKKAGVKVHMGQSLRAFSFENQRFYLQTRKGDKNENFSCDYMIAADGRHSTVAGLLGAKAQIDQNDRATYFCYVQNLKAPHPHRSLFALSDNKMSFLYPQRNGTHLLSHYFDKTLLSNVKKTSLISIPYSRNGRLNS
ncbi:NAD(P)/FAD-dependent oxidoreductase [Bartonella sp. DGB2]|uniref:NAD(P)/FAD-dependent oxidoreductase n=1 Tax=Bartonella sp. DGB2 TaxID=3388426 RepID=UPI003990318D